MNQNSNQKQLAKFNLCKSLVELVGVKQATADLHYLYEHHKHDKMFDSEEEVKTLIEEVVKEPEIITKAHTKNSTLAAKRLNQPNKMGEVVVVNDEGKIIHANKKRLSAFEKLKASLVKTPTPSTHRDLPTEELTTRQDELSGASARSAKHNDIISQTPNQNQADSADSRDESTQTAHKRKRQ